MTFFRSSHLYTRLRDKIPTSLQWQQVDSATKGDPRKSVKWIDVSYEFQTAIFTAYKANSFSNNRVYEVSPHS